MISERGGGNMIFNVIYILDPCKITSGVYFIFNPIQWGDGEGGI